MTYAIKDTFTNEYFCSRTTNFSWYHSDIRRARFYTDRKYAEMVIKMGDHHVTWPGDRKLVVVSVKIEEINNA